MKIPQTAEETSGMTTITSSFVDDDDRRRHNGRKIINSICGTTTRTSHKITGIIGDSGSGLWGGSAGGGGVEPEAQGKQHQQQRGSDHLEDPATTTATDSDISYSIGPADNMLTSKKKVSLFILLWLFSQFCFLEDRFKRLIKKREQQEQNNLNIIGGTKCVSYYY